MAKNDNASSRDPENAIRPSATKIILWNASKIAELGWWIVHKTVRPRIANDFNCDINTLAEFESCPVVGSSRNKIFGSDKSYKEKKNWWNRWWKNPFIHSIIYQRMFIIFLLQLQMQVFFFLHQIKLCHLHLCQF